MLPVWGKCGHFHTNGENNDGVVVSGLDTRNLDYGIKGAVELQDVRALLELVRSRQISF